MELIANGGSEYSVIEYIPADRATTGKGRSGGWNWKSQFNLTMFEVPSSPMIVETVVPYKERVYLASPKDSSSSTFQELVKEKEPIFRTNKGTFFNR